MTETYVVVKFHEDISDELSKHIWEWNYPGTIKVQGSTAHEVLVSIEVDAVHKAIVPIADAFHEMQLETPARYFELQVLR
jgi:hypothetical protein